MLFNKRHDEEPPHDAAAFYRNGANAPAPSHAQIKSVNATRSVIDPWLLITGNLEGEGELQVDGKVHGDIRCAHLIVGKEATISGNIIANEVVVRGTVNGIIRANRVILQSSARVESEIYHKTLAIEEGACFEGTARLRQDPMKEDTLKPQVAELQAMANDMKVADKAKSKGKAARADGAAAAGSYPPVEEAVEAMPAASQPTGSAESANGSKPAQAMTSLGAEVERVRAQLRERRA